MDRTESLTARIERLFRLSQTRQLTNYEANELGLLSIDLARQIDFELYSYYTRGRRT